RHVAQSERMRQGAAEALARARAAERALLIEKDRLAVTLADLTRLHESSTRLLKQNDLGAILCDVLVRALDPLRPDKGSVQLYDEREGVLRIVAHVGFSPQYLELFKTVLPGFSVYGAALERCERIIVEDASADDRFAALAPVYASHDFVAMQSTPLIG